MPGRTFDRRGILLGAGAAALVTATGRSRAGATVSVGIVYGGPRDDRGFNRSHALAAAALAAQPGLSVVEEEAEPGRIAATAGRLAGERGCDLLLVPAPTPALAELLAEADRHPGTLFLLCRAAVEGERLPVNVALYGGHIDEGQHISGMVAGYGSRTRRIGFVAPDPRPEVLRCVNAFALGARRADAQCTIVFRCIGTDAPAEAVSEAARALLAEGVDVLAGHLRSVAPLCEAAEAAGARCCGLHTDLSALAPTGFLSGAEWDWTRVCEVYIQKLRDKVAWPAELRGGLGSGIVRCSSYGAAVGPEARAHADAARFQLANGNAHVFRGPILDTQGRAVVRKGAALVSGDPALDRMSWLAEGVVDLTR